MTKHQQPSPNDNRSNVKNPNNPAHEADQVNREATASPAPNPPTATPVVEKPKQ